MEANGDADRSAEEEEVEQEQEESVRRTVAILGSRSTAAEEEGMEIGWRRMRLREAATVIDPRNKEIGRAHV